MSPELQDEITYLILGITTVTMVMKIGLFQSQRFDLFKVLSPWLNGNGMKRDVIHMKDRALALPTCMGCSKKSQCQSSEIKNQTL